MSDRVKSRLRLFVLSIVFFVAACGGNKSGLSVDKYIGTWSELPDFNKLTPLTQYVTDVVQAEKNEARNYGLVMAGILSIEDRGKYRFHLRSDDGARLFIDGELVVDNDGMHDVRTKVSQELNLVAGDHDIRIEYFRNGRGNILALLMQSEGEDAVPIPSDMFFHTDDKGGSGGGGGGDPEKFAGPCYEPL